MKKDGSICYSAYSPVMHSKTPPNDSHPCLPFRLKKSNIYFGLKARNTPMSCLNKLQIPIPAMNENHTKRIGANKDPTL